MAADGMLLPIVFREHAQLVSLGIKASDIVFSHLTLDGERFVCVRETPPEGSAAGGFVVIVDLSDGSSTPTLIRRQSNADSAMMHPTRKVLALKSDRELQVFDLDSKSKIASCIAPEHIVFWKWATHSKIALISEHSCYLWSVPVDGSAAPAPAPVKAFDRNPALASSQIINVGVNANATWMFVIGISLVNQRVVGKIQLYNTARAASQMLDGHAAVFADLRLDCSSTDNCPQLFAFAARGEGASKLHIIEIDRPMASPTGAALTAEIPPYGKKNTDIFFPPEANHDFPVAMLASAKYGILFLVTKFGYVHLYDIETASCVFMNRISGDTVFATANYEAVSGMIGVNRKGQVLSVAVDENNIVPYIRSTLNNPELAMRVATRCGLPGADDVCIQVFEQHFAAGNYTEAVRVAAKSPKGLLRTPQTLERLRQAPAQPNTATPLLQYFGLLLETGALNKSETLELARPILAQGRKNILEKWLKQDKLHYCEELGDLMKPHDVDQALAIYLRSNVPAKTVACFAETGRFDKIAPYCQKFSYKPDFLSLLQNVMRSNADRGTEFATKLSQTNPPLVPVSQMVDVFLSSNLVQQATAFLLDYLKENKPEHAALQTRLLEMNLVHAPQVADAIIGNAIFTHYDRSHIAQMCEKAGLYQRALEHYTEIYDIKRTLVHTHLLSPDWVIGFFSRLSIDQSLECLREMLNVNLRQNLQICVQIAIKYSEILGPAKLIALFEECKSPDAIYYYLGSVVNLSQDPDVHYKYIQAACRTGQLKEVERICRESNVYDPERVKNFLKDSSLADQLPLIIVCDRFNFVHDLILYLYKNNQFKYIELYVQKVNSVRTPQVIGALLDVGCEENVIRQLLVSLRGAVFPSDAMVHEVETRNRLRFLLPWLEMKVKDNNADVHVYNAIAKIYVDSNNNAEGFLRENKQYDHRVIGAYCEKRNPQMAYIAYEQGKCDKELLELTNRESMFKLQARYLIRRRDKALWISVLQDSNTHRRALVDQIVSNAIPESQDSDEVSTAVKAFMECKLHAELMEVLEKIVLENTIFSENEYLQNLLILTAIQCERTKVMDYINRLNNFNASQIASVALASDLFEEAFMIYKRCSVNDLAITVLCENIKDLRRAEEFALRVEQPNVWSILAAAQLKENMVMESMSSYVRVTDASNWAAVIAAAKDAELWPELLEYLKMARVKVREGAIESELLFCFAKTDRLPDLEEFLSAPNIADISSVGERCFDEQLYLAAKILFGSVSNWARLATTFTHLGEYSSAVECATKAGSVVVWREVHGICLSKKEFKLALHCGLQLVVHADELEPLCEQYKSLGLIDELISLLETSLNLERAHMGLFTELSVLYSIHKPEKLMDHVKVYCSKLNIPKVIRATEAAHLWKPLVFLYTHHEEYDNAALTMIQHSVICFDHAKFKEIILKIRNQEVYYRAVRFYLDEHPLLLNEFLVAVAPKIDHSRVVQMVQKSHNIPLIKPYLVSVLPMNNAQVNDAYHALLIEEEDHVALRSTVESIDNFDILDLAQQLSKHELLEFRRIAAFLYRKTKRWKQSIALSKKDNVFKDAMETASESKDVAITEDLLDFFIKEGKKECFAALLFNCYNVLRPDVILELAWRHNLTDQAMPFLIQSMRDLTLKVDFLQRDAEKRAKRDHERERQENNQPAMMPMPLMLPPAPSLMQNTPHSTSNVAIGGYVGHPQMMTSQAPANVPPQIMHQPQGQPQQIPGVVFPSAPNHFGGPPGMY